MPGSLGAQYTFPSRAVDFYSVLKSVFCLPSWVTEDNFLACVPQYCHLQMGRIIPPFRISSLLSGSNVMLIRHSEPLLCSVGALGLKSQWLSQWRLPSLSPLPLSPLLIFPPLRSEGVKGIPGSSKEVKRIGTI